MPPSLSGHARELGVMDAYGVTSTSVATLGLITYLLGLAIGSVVVAPLSELYGRRVVYIVCMVVFVLPIMPCGFAKSLAVILVVRFFCALFGAALVFNSPGRVRMVDSGISVPASPHRHPRIGIPISVLSERKEVLARGRNLEIRSTKLNRTQLG